MTATLDELLIEVQALRKEVHRVYLFVECSARGLLAPIDDEMDPTVFFEPRQYRGPICKGKKMSQTSPLFLDAYAHALAYIADKERDENAEYNGRPKWKMTAATAARARRWSFRLRADVARPPAADVIDAGRRSPFASQQQDQVANANAGGDDASFNFGANQATDDDDDSPL